MTFNKNRISEENIRQKLEEKNILPKKRNLIVPLLIFILAVATCLGTIVFIEYKKQRNSSYLAQVKPTTIPTPSQTESSVTKEFNTSEWKDYSLSAIGLSFKAPPELKVAFDQKSDEGYPTFYIQDYPFGAPPPDVYYKMGVTYKQDKNYTKNDLVELKKDQYYPQDKNFAKLDVLSGISVDRNHKMFFVEDNMMFEITTTQRNDKNIKLSENIVSTFVFR